jgi:DNA invertase Pin-like site-specific DNA recombinase
MLIGYARVSTQEQNLDFQIDALEKAGCERIITDEISGKTTDRQGLSAIKEIMRRGDTIVVWRLDRLGRSLKHLLEFVADLETKEINFKSLQETIDTTSSTGKLIFHIFGALAEFERNLIRERSKAGLTAARARGRTGGRPKKLDVDKIKLVVSLYNERKQTVKEICKLMGISRTVLYRYIRER